MTYNAGRLAIEYSEVVSQSTTAVPRKRLTRVLRQVFFGALFLFTVTGAVADSSTSEYQVKAAFLYNFSRFVVWPSGSFAHSSSPLVIGVVGQDPFGSSLDKVTDGKTVDGRNIVIRRFRRVSDIEQCHVLFVSDSERERLPRILDRVENRGTLTVSEIDGFIARGGMINFAVESKKVRFDINSGAAERARLRISAKLLQLARTVKRS
jgi:hypothetical protein